MPVKSAFLRSSTEKAFNDFNLVKCHTAPSSLTSLAQEDGGGLAIEEDLKLTTQLIMHGFNHDSDKVKELTGGRPECMMTTLYGSILLCLDDMFQLKSDSLTTALARVKQATELADHKRKKGWSGWWPHKGDYDGYSDEQIHAELVYADGMIVTAIITIQADQSIMGFINGALNARAAYQSYQECYNILKYKKTWKSSCSKMHFENGVRLAVGGFELMISYLPSKFIKLLEFAGFSGNRAQGLRELDVSLQLTDTVRWPVTVIIFVMYNIFLEMVFGLGETDVRSLESLVRKTSLRYPRNYLKKTSPTSRIPMPIKHTSYLFLVWAHALKCEWSQAAKYAKLLKECNWSPASSHYMYAINLAMVADEENRQTELRREISDNLNKVPLLKKTFGGKKRTFHEKLVLGRSKMFAERPDQLMLAPLEIAYIFNLVKWIKGRNEFIDPLVERIDAKLVKMAAMSRAEQSQLTYNDQLAYLTFMKAICFKLKGSMKKAIALLDKVYQMRHVIYNDTHLAAQAAYELGLAHRSAHNLSEAVVWLTRAKTDFPGNYSETMINYRAGLVLDAIKNSSVKSKSRSNSIIGSFLLRKLSTSQQER
ncbi:Tetratricopeptide repeat protein 39B [Halotydeus destructor]|nr:Tetratricopeptide repeat protein 39B [Halotydeus destructor]